jgi:hypothetical protein
MNDPWPCWRVYYRPRWGPYRLLLALADAPTREAALGWAWRHYPGHEPMRIDVERQGEVCGGR